MKKIIYAAWLATLACGSSAGEKDLDLYLLIGQSNMAGRGRVELQDQEKPKRVFTLNKENEWVPAVDPIHFDKKIAGVGPGRSFGIAMSKQSKSVKIGLIPCAVGGTSIRYWVPGGEHTKTQSHPYDDMLVRLRLAMKSGTVKGILWHQGEGDSKMGQRGTYEAAMVELIDRVRTECGDQTIPFVIGQLGQFPERPWSDGRTKVNEAQQGVAKTVPLCAFASSDGLEDKGDLTHFSAEAARELGKRFAEKMIELQKSRN
ncbi:MAG: sialate O-acetylesterase [Pontiella sp.]